MYFKSHHDRARRNVPGIQTWNKRHMNDRVNETRDSHCAVIPRQGIWSRLHYLSTGASSQWPIVSGLSSGSAR